MQRAVSEESKLALRRAMMSVRASLSPAQSGFWSGLIQDAVLRFPLYLAASEVALYSPIENEVSTNIILAHALESQKRVFYPRIGDDNTGWFFQVSAEAELQSGRFGIREPVELNPLAGSGQEDRDDRVVFVPGVAFDLRGSRLGRGGGWYDRMLSALKGHGLFVGLAFELQIVDQVMAETWDQKVHYLITEKRVIDCGISVP
jgi:5-formyltetrahydrofolate cyclo-ligase